MFFLRFCCVADFFSRSQGEMEMFRVCVACARNCHKGRLGHRTRFCKLSNTRCMCCERGEGSCLYFSKKVSTRGVGGVGGVH